MNVIKRIKQILTAKTISVTNRLLNEQDKLNLAKDEIKEKYNKLVYVLGKTLAGKANIESSISDCNNKMRIYKNNVRNFREDPTKKDDAIYYFSMYKEYETLTVQLKKQSEDFEKRIEVLKDKAKQLNIFDTKLSAKIDILEVRLAAAKNNTSFTLDSSDDTSVLIKEVETSIRGMECMNEATEIVNQARIDENVKPIIDEDEMMKL